MEAFARSICMLYVTNFDELLNSMCWLFYYSAFQTFRQSAFRKRNENTEYFTYIQYDFQKDKPKTISEIYSKGVNSSRLSNLMRLKVR